MQVNCAEMWTQFGSRKTEDQGQEFDRYRVDPWWESLTTRNEDEKHTQGFNAHTGGMGTSAIAGLEGTKRFDR
jgi:hypothetical protein